MKTRSTKKCNWMHNPHINRIYRDLSYCLAFFFVYAGSLIKFSEIYFLNGGN